MRRFVGPFVENVLQPFLEAGSPAEQLTDVVDQVKRLHPLGGARAFLFCREHVPATDTREF